jgi:hypothetical protein
MTNSEPEQQQTQFDWRFWFQWILATTLGWLVGLFLLGEVGIGASIGVAQWLVLRREVTNAGWWILVSAVAWLVGWELIAAGLFLAPGTDLISSLIVGALMGLVLGVGQWLLLRRWTYSASLWIPANLSAWSVAFTGILGGAIMAGVVAGAVTGLVLDLLLRYPRIEKEIL